MKTKFFIIIALDSFSVQSYTTEVKQKGEFEGVLLRTDTPDLYYSKYLANKVVSKTIKFVKGREKYLGDIWYETTYVVHEVNLEIGLFHKVKNV